MTGPPRTHQPLATVRTQQRRMGSPARRGLCCGLLALSTGCAASVERPGLGWRTGIDAAPPGPIERAADLAARAADHGPLVSSTSAPDARELRLWVGFGLQSYLLYLRFIEDGEGVRGEMIAQWDERPDETCGERTAELHAALGCLELRNVGRAVACVLEPARPILWSGVLRRLEKLGVWRLRDESSFPDRVALHDGVCLVAALRAGTRWRRYTLCNPDAQPYADAKPAAAIIDFVLDLAPAPNDRMPWDEPLTIDLPTLCRPGAAPEGAG